MTDMPKVIYAYRPASSQHDCEWRTTPGELATEYIRADEVPDLIREAVQKYQRGEDYMVIDYD